MKILLRNISATGLSFLIFASGTGPLWAANAPTHANIVRQLDEPFSDLQLTSGGLLGLKCMMLAFALETNATDSEQSSRAIAKFRKWQQFAIVQQPDSASLAPAMERGVRWARPASERTAPRDRFALNDAYLRSCDMLRSERFRIDETLPTTLFPPPISMASLEQSILRKEADMAGPPHNTLGLKCFALALDIKRVPRATVAEQAFAQQRAVSWVSYGEIPPATAQLMASVANNPASRWANSILASFQGADRITAAQTYLRACELISSR